MTTVQPAPRWRRIAAALVDTALGCAVLWVVSLGLPNGGPPADAMAFYSPQDFKNYATLVYVGCGLQTVYAVMIVATPWRSTVGHWVAGIRLVSLHGTSTPAAAVVRRWLRALLGLLAITVPGPVVAFLVVFITVRLFHAPFTTADDALRSIGAPTVVRLGLHSLSFLALGAALWLLLIRPLGLHALGARVLTRRDRATGTTYTERR